MKTYALRYYLRTGDPIISEEAVFTMKLEPELRAEFMAAAEAAHRPVSQILRELMREFVQRQREAREYDEFLRRKVEAGRRSRKALLDAPGLAPCTRLFVVSGLQLIQQIPRCGGQHQKSLACRGKE